MAKCPLNLKETDMQILAVIAFVLIVLGIVLLCVLPPDGED
jgi:hypothetical protein